jgi:hypothetical protein
MEDIAKRLRLVESASKSAGARLRALERSSLLEARIRRLEARVSSCDSRDDRGDDDTSPALPASDETLANQVLLPRWCATVIRWCATWLIAAASWLVTLNQHRVPPPPPPPPPQAAAAPAVAPNLPPRYKVLPGEDGYSDSLVLNDIEDGKLS